MNTEQETPEHIAEWCETMRDLIAMEGELRDMLRDMRERAANAERELAEAEKVIISASGELRLIIGSVKYHDNEKRNVLLSDIELRKIQSAFCDLQQWLERRRKAQ